MRGEQRTVPWRGEGVGSFACGARLRRHSAMMRSLATATCRQRCVIVKSDGESHRSKTEAKSQQDGDNAAHLGLCYMNSDAIRAG